MNKQNTKVKRVDFCYTLSKGKKTKSRDCKSFGYIIKGLEIRSVHSSAFLFEIFSNRSEVNKKMRIR